MKGQFKGLQTFGHIFFRDEGSGERERERMIMSVVVLKDDCSLRWR
jgi:hypothetical protein